jgi:hypothetical protein
VENLNVSDRHGWMPYPRQARATVALPILSFSASSREDQCVTPSLRGGGSNVAVMIASWSTVRGRPERAASSRPANPEDSYRDRQSITVGRDTPTFAAISVFDTPSAASNTIRARWARPARIELARVHAVSRSRSPSRSANGAAARAAMPNSDPPPCIN